VFMADDHLALRVAQPLRVRSGGLGFDLPVGWDYERLAATRGVRRLSLAPRGREVAGELAWRGELWGGSASASLFWRKEPGHMAGARDDRGLAIGWKTGL